MWGVYGYDVEDEEGGCGAGVGGRILVVLKRNTKLDKINISGIRFSDIFYIYFVCLHLYCA